MSTEQQVERLSALLATVQKNRQKPRAVGLSPVSTLGTALPANTTGAVSPARPAPIAQPGPGAFVQPGTAAAGATRPRRPTPTEPITAAVAPPPTPVREETMETPQRRPRPASSPLESALSNQLEREERQLPSPPRAPAPPAAPAAPVSNDFAARMPGGTQPRSQRPPASQLQPEAAAQQPIVPRVIEPDPPRASTRPIAQVVSKHAPVVDATFGAMLKRSLSLRPH